MGCPIHHYFIQHQYTHKLRKNMIDTSEKSSHEIIFIHVSPRCMTT
uniref:Uncharacterized protein n=1 Tax=Arundo donax TaxID=35708 RepID=A0A0A8ZN88_ARUDO